MAQPTATPANRAREAAGIPGKELSVVEQRTNARIAVVQSMLPAFRDAMRTEVDAKQLVRDGITALRTIPKLIECTQESFLGSLMTAAQLRLRPNTVLGHGWVLPFENRKRGVVEAQWVLGYKGMVTLAARSGVSVVARSIYSNEVYVVEFGLNERLEHTPILNVAERGDPIAHYAIARSATGGAWTIISEEEALAARDASPGYRFGGPDNPWRTNPGPMKRKTAVRRLFAFVPTDSPELAMGIASDSVLRTDVEPEALGIGEEEQDGTEAMTVTRAPEPETITVQESSTPAATPDTSTQGEPEQQPGAATSPGTATSRTRTPKTSLVRALQARAADAHGPALPEVISAVLEPELLATIPALSSGGGPDVEYLRADELRRVIAFDWQGYLDGQIDAAYAAEEVGE